MAQVNLVDLVMQGNLAAIRKLARSLAERVVAVASKLSPQGQRALLGRVAALGGILDNSYDPATAAAVVQELAEAAQAAEKVSQAPVSGVRGMGSSNSGVAGMGSSNSGVAGMGSSLEGAELEEIRAQNRASLGMGAPLDFSNVGSNIATNLFDASVRGVTFKTTMTPEMTYAPGAPGEPAQVTNASGGPGEFVLQILKPELDIETPAGRVKLAPYGSPTSNYFWPAVVVFATGLGSLLYFAMVGVKQKIRRST